MNLIIGGTGFVGGHLVEYLFQQGEISKGLFRKGSHLKILDTNGVQGIEGDVLDHHSLHEGMEGGVDTVLNLASSNPTEDAEFMKVNTEGILNILEVANESGVRTIVHLSALDVFGFNAKNITASTPIAPSTDYQRAKAESERLLNEYSKRKQTPRIIIIRPAKAVGSRDESLVIPILKMAKSGKVTVPENGKMSFTHPTDIAQAMLKASTGSSPTGSTYLLKSFDSTPIELARSIVDATGGHAGVKRPGMFGGSSIGKYTEGQLKGGLTIDAQESWKELGYAPSFDLESTAQEIAKWYKKDPWAVEGD
jgi:nucleoside-diphosphate-sugar epimerase